MSMNKLKILVFEYITGGGLNKSELPESLAKEGLLMLRSLVDGLTRIGNLGLTIMLDHRMKESLAGSLNNIHIINPTQDCQQEFTRLLDTCDAAWPIAPESEGILHSLCRTVEESGKCLLVSRSYAVAVTGDKWQTYTQLSHSPIGTIPTQSLVDFDWSPGEWMLKPVDGVGCEDSYLIGDHEDFIARTAKLDKAKYIIQPHIPGGKTSLSCLFKEGRGWLLCANRQHFGLINKQYRLLGIDVNFTFDTKRYLGLVEAIAGTMAGLWGYVGIDLIERDGQIFVLEINPRLTTSYAGIDKALGINCAKAVVELLAGDPQLAPSRNQPVHIRITGEKHVVS